MTVTKAKEEKDLYDIYITMVHHFKMVKGDNYITKAKAAPKKMREKYPLIAYLATLDESQSVSSFINNMMDSFIKQFNTDQICSRGGDIDGGNKVSTRNVATSRMADLLGISDMVSHSETAEMKYGHRVVVGNVMDEAKGYEASRIARKWESKHRCK